MIKEVTYYKLVCDSCGNEYYHNFEPLSECGDYKSTFENAKKAIELAKEYRWGELYGKLLCNRCLPMAKRRLTFKKLNLTPWKLERMTRSIAGICLSNGWDFGHFILSHEISDIIMQLYRTGTRPTVNPPFTVWRDDKGNHHKIGNKSLTFDRCSDINAPFISVFIDGCAFVLIDEYANSHNPKKIIAKAYQMKETLENINGQKYELKDIVEFMKKGKEE